jgi:hypothetical protein
LKHRANAPISSVAYLITSLRKHQKLRWFQELEFPCGIFEFTIMSITTDEATIGAILIVSDVTEWVHSDIYICNTIFGQLTGLTNRFLLHGLICLLHSKTK